MAENDRIRLYRVGPTPDESKKIFETNKNDISPWLREHVETSGILRASGRWFTSDRSEAEWYLREHPTYKVRHVDVKVEDAARWMAKDHPTAAGFSSQPMTEYFIPAIVANQAQPERQIALIIQAPTRGLSR